MQLLTGPAGSGKTTLLLDRFREALKRGDAGVRLLVPTATMAQHLQNRMAREGFVFRPGLVETLSRFLDDWSGGAAPVSEAVLYLVVEAAARRVCRPEFARVTGLAGFCASLARTIEEFSSAGCGSERLERNLPDTPLGEAFLAVYREVDRELERRGLALRASRLERAARLIEGQGLGGVHTVWLDGFHALPDPELEVLRALGRRAEVTVSLTDNTATRTTRDRLLAMGFAETRLAGRRPSPAMVLVKAANVEREADEIARRILEQNRAGRPFREIGIIVRSPEIYVPVLGATLERFGIPARFYFDGHLEEHAVTRYLVGAVEAMLGGWDHQATLAVLRLAPRLADSTAMDRFDFAVREQMPDRGLGPLKALLLPGEGREPSPGAGRIARLIDQLGELDEWQSFTLDPKDWAARFREMRRFFHPARPADGAGHEPALAWRGQAAVLDLFDEALGEAAAALAGARHIALAAFWSAVKSVLRLKPLRLDDRRRNLVHVLGAHEARQWELPVVFVCGLVERQFPRFHPQDPFFPDAARVRLNQAGIRVRTAAEFEMEERALFDLATSRATMLVTLSYPEFDARGDRNLPSLYLEDFTVPREDPRTVRPRPRGLDLPKPAVAIAAPALLDRLRAATAALGPTTLEQYRQCPFQFFGARTLRLQPAPARPHDRLDPMLQGTIVHRFLQEWWVEPQPVDPLFDRIFAELCEENRVPPGYRTARLRDSILDDLRAFAADSSWPRGQFQSSAEQSFQFPLDGSLEIRGKIDRIDAGPDGRAWVIDYKYSGAQATRDKLDNRNLLQAPLYFLAAEEFFGLRPAGMFYIGLRGGVKYAGWAEGDAPVAAEPLPENWTADARAAALSAVAGIRAGRIAPAPADPDRCRFCDYRDVCRVEMAAAAAAVEGA